MTIRISKSELRILGYLHEHATRFNAGDQYDPTTVAANLETSDEQLQKDLSFLHHYKLIDGDLSMNSMGSGFLSFWLTGDGESVMRKAEDDLAEELSKNPDVKTTGKTITAKAAGWLMDTAQKIVVDVVAKAINGG
jgi:hypothetical protein